MSKPEVGDVATSRPKANGQILPNVIPTVAGAVVPSNRLSGDDSVY